MKLKNALGKIFGEPSMAVSIPKIELYGKRELVMTGCTHIAEFAPDKVILSSPDMSVSIEGDRLELLLLAKKTVAVRGRIDTVSLPDGNIA